MISLLTERHLNNKQTSTEVLGDFQLHTKDHLGRQLANEERERTF